MNLTKMRSALSDPDGRFPDTALQWARGNVALATPALLAMLTACAKAGDLADREAVAAFYALPMLAELREARAFPLICALARNGDRIDDIYADFGAEFLPRLLVGLYNGDDAFFKEIAGDTSIEPMVRASFLRAWCWHVLHVDEDRSTARDALALLGSTIPADAGFLWFEWAQARIAIDPDAGRSVLHEAADMQALPPEAIDDLRQEIAAWREDPAGQRDTYLVENGPIADAIGTLDQWFAREEDATDETADVDAAAPDDAEHSPVQNQMRDVGRNDPCPCGSGKKFKKCCLPKTIAEGAAG